MPSSIPHAAPGPLSLDEALEVRARVQRDDLLDLVRVIRDALDVRSASQRDALLDTRAQLVCNTLSNVLDGSVVLGTAWETELLRQELALVGERPRIAVGAARIVASRNSMPAARSPYVPAGGGRDA